MGRNPQVLAAAFRVAKAKKAKIAQLGITADMTEDEIDSLVMSLAEAKAIEKEAPMKDFVAGQQWYVEQLVTFAGMTAKERLDAEFEDKFPEVASEEELLALLEDDEPVEEPEPTDPVVDTADTEEGAGEGTDTEAEVKKAA
jgi:hypothetical protein